MARFRRLRVQVGRMNAKLRPARRAVSRARGRMSRGARKNMRSMGVGRARSLLVLPVLLMMIMFAALLGVQRQETTRFVPAEKAIANPLMGIAASARTDLSSAPEDTRLVWAVASWRELEPEEGVYAFDAFDEAIHLAQWRERGAKLIFRLALDIMDSGFERDIPDWLYEKVGGGSPYEIDGRKCYAPDYASPILQERHMQLLQAVEERYGDDIAYVEMGSLGANGTWESADGVPQMPMTDVTGVYIWQYFTAFPEHAVLSAGPYHEAALLEGGAYLNGLGEAGRTWDWINRFRFGGWDGEVGVLLRADAEFGLRSPAGAWLADEGADLLENGDGAINRMAAESRATYICVDYSALALSDAALDKLNDVSQGIGYRLWIRQAQWAEKVRPDYSLYVDICMANDGISPMPQSWPVCLALLDDGGAVVHSEKVEADPGEWMPGDTQLRVRLTVPYDMDRGRYTLAIAVCDPDTLEPAVQFAMDCETVGLWHVLGTVVVG